MVGRAPRSPHTRVGEASARQRPRKESRLRPSLRRVARSSRPPIWSNQVLPPNHSSARRRSACPKRTLSTKASAVASGRVIASLQPCYGSPLGSRKHRPVESCHCCIPHPPRTRERLPLSTQKLGLVRLAREVGLPDLRSTCVIARRSNNRTPFRCAVGLDQRRPTRAIIGAIAECSKGVFFVRRQFGLLRPCRRSQPTVRAAHRHIRAWQPVQFASLRSCPPPATAGLSAAAE